MNSDANINKIYDILSKNSIKSSSLYEQRFNRNNEVISYRNDFDKTLPKKNEPKPKHSKK